MTDVSDPSTDELQRLLDIHEITQLKARYCRFVDTKDWDAFGAQLVDDYYFDSDGGILEGRDAVVAMVKRALGTAMTIHQVHNPEITFTGPDDASAIWPMYDYVILAEDGDQFVLHGYGYYLEDYVRTRDGWRLQRCEERRLRVDTAGTVPSGVAELQQDAS